MCARQTSRIGGSSETEVKLFAVKPAGSARALSVVVTIVTPVAKAPSASRSAFLSLGAA